MDTKHNTPKKARRKKAHQAAKAIDFIQEQIRTGKYLSGQRLVEAEVAADAGVGISPIREAIRYLAGEGVIDVVPHRGATVKRIDTRDLVLILQVLAGLGGVQLRLAARKKLTAAETGLLRRALEDMEAAAQRRELEEMMAHSETFHRRLSEVVGNPYLTVCLDRLHLDLFARAMGSRLDFADWNIYYIRMYRAILAALEAGDEATAVRIFEEHSAFLIARAQGEWIEWPATARDDRFSSAR